MVKYLIFSILVNMALQVFVCDYSTQETESGDECAVGFSLSEY